MKKIILQLTLVLISINLIFIAKIYAVGEPGPSAGYNHPNNYLTVKPTLVADNMEPVILHPEQTKEAKDKLKKLAKKFGKKPNLVIFLMDDVGWSDPGFNGGGVRVGNPTPKIDRYANNGLILTSAYSQPSCTPTRATINTGQLPIHHGMLRPPMYDEKGGLEGAITLPMLLGQLGYVTQAIGKWHLGESPGSQPQNVGYDDFRGFLGVSNQYTEWRDHYFNPEVTYSPQRTKYMENLNFDHYESKAKKGGKQENIQLLDLTTIQNLDQGWVAYGDEFIRKMAKNENPFFLYYNTRGCHFDNYPNDYYKGRSPARTSYSDCIIEMDDVFGRLMTALEETGQLENTLIIFTSDNGPEDEITPHGRTPFKGSKGSTWEGGIRVPTFVYWKDMIAPRQSDGLFDLADIFNTFVTVANGDLVDMIPKDRYVDGIDQTSFILAEDGLSNRRSIISFLLTEMSAVRMDEFKSYRFQTNIHADLDQGNIGGFSGVDSKPTYGRMYNVYADPQEESNIGIRHLWNLPLMQAEEARYFNVLKKYPPSKNLITME